MKKKVQRFKGYLPVRIANNSCEWCPMLRKSTIDNHMYCGRTSEPLPDYDERRGEECPLEDVREMGGDEV